MVCWVRILFGVLLWGIHIGVLYYQEILQMKIRRYMASNMQEALLKVKMDLGSDAVILNTRKVKRQV